MEFVRKTRAEIRRLGCYRSFDMVGREYQHEFVGGWLLDSKRLEATVANSSFALPKNPASITWLY